MSIDYLALFPIPADQLPDRLRKLLEPVGNAPRQRVEVTSRFDFDTYGPEREYVHMIMAVVPDDGPEITPLLDASGTGVVSYSVPVADEKGNCRDFTPSVAGYDYLVASWGSSSFFTYNLAEKVWMTLGLTPRCLGNDYQRIIYDDLSLPEFGVAEGEVSTEFYWSPKREIRWTISNEYLRKYLWMRGAHGVRVFFYQALLPDRPELRRLMHGQTHFATRPEGGWYELDIQEHEGRLLIQVWATVKAVSPDLCAEQSADGIIWPGVDGPMTHARANALLHSRPAFLDDKFLERYEQNSFYETTPVNIAGSWWCSPSYRGQWSFSDCVRVGRNLIRVPLRELYKAKPDREILHAHAFAMSPDRIAHLDLKEEHIVAKTQRLLDQLLVLGDNLSELASAVGLSKRPQEIVGFSRAELRANGWTSYGQLSRLAQVAPLDMSQQAFLSRCKSLHEVWQRVPEGFLKSLLERAGCARADIKSLRTLKLLQVLLNITERLNAHQESREAFRNQTVAEGWDARNAAMAPLFVANDLRIADAHEAIGRSLKVLQDLGFDTASVNEGYGRSLDFVMDGMIASFGTINEEISTFLAR